MLQCVSGHRMYVPALAGRSTTNFKGGLAQIKILTRRQVWRLHSPPAVCFACTASQVCNWCASDMQLVFETKVNAG